MFTYIFRGVRQMPRTWTSFKDPGRYRCDLCRRFCLVLFGASSGSAAVVIVSIVVVVVAVVVVVVSCCVVL